jgi:hypothetical protein
VVGGSDGHDSIQKFPQGRRSRGPDWPYDKLLKSADFDLASERFARFGCPSTVMFANAQTLSLDRVILYPEDSTSPIGPWNPTATSIQKQLLLFAMRTVSFIPTTPSTKSSCPPGGHDKGCRRRGSENSV